MEVDADTTIRVGASWPTSLLRLVRGENPPYPRALRERGVTGIVRATFVVDTTGHVVPGSVRLLEESDRAFGDAVCGSLTRVEFTPAIVGGRRLTVRIDDHVTMFSITRMSR